MKANHSSVNDSFRKNDKAMAGAALGACIALLVSILVGVLVYYKIAASTSTNFVANTAADRAIRIQLNNTNSTASTTFTLAPIIAIVLIAGIILAIVTRFGSGGGM